MKKIIKIDSISFLIYFSLKKTGSVDTIGAELVSQKAISEENLSDHIDNVQSRGKKELETPGPMRSFGSHDVLRQLFFFRLSFFIAQYPTM